MLVIPADPKVQNYLACNFATIWFVLAPISGTKKRWLKSQCRKRPLTNKFSFYENKFLYNSHGKATAVSFQAKKKTENRSSFKSIMTIQKKINIESKLQIPTFQICSEYVKNGTN